MSIMHCYSPYNHCMRERSKTKSMWAVDPYYVTMTLKSFTVTITLVCALWISASTWPVQCDRHQITYWGDGAPLHIVSTQYSSPPVAHPGPGGGWCNDQVRLWWSPSALPTFRTHTYSPWISETWFNESIETLYIDNTYEWHKTQWTYSMYVATDLLLCSILLWS